MKALLSELTIRGACRDLLERDLYASGRALLRDLNERYGAVGKTQRVLAIWREERAAKRRLTDHRQAPMPPTHPDREQELEELRARAERAELREQSHQERWMAEIDRLREQLRAQSAQLRSNAGLQDQVLELRQENTALRQQLRSMPRS